VKKVRKVLNRRHSFKWGALTGILGGATALTQYIPQSWPTWLAAGLTVVALALSGIAAFIKPSDGD
jgi:hypothetical protein